MLRLKVFSVIPMIALVAACSNMGANYTPIIDGPVGPNYANDLAQCQALARQQGTLDANTAGMALGGAAVGGATAAIVNNKGSNARDAAMVGALVGGAASAASNVNSKEVIVRNCMRGRGYNVVK
ncbi:glycine zipper family protein [Tropicimonas sp. IMCC34043]|uniref:glycine zipper family protein n=1 Tax=Tropicimonas sp. IMCC34043 TaxID=2248760 RepID=UPI000E27D8A1|nr:glycine zipper family protein [Tropicimonas sp. IMCC34043]